MDFEERSIGFREADRRFDDLIRSREAGEINEREFDAARKKLMVRDEDGRWWAKSVKTGEWRVYENGEWRPGVPPGMDTRPPSPPNDDEASHPPPEEESAGASSRSEISNTSVVREKPMVVRRRRRVGRWVVLAVGVAAVAFGAVSFLGSGLGAAYALVENEGLSVEAPSDWSEHIMEDSEGEKGRASWSSWVGDGGDIGPSITAVNGLDAWQNGEAGHQGMYMVASKELTQWEDEYLVEAGPNDYWETCEGGEIQNFDREEYSGKILRWNECGGESGHIAVTLAAAPEGRECVVVMQIGGYFQTEEDEAKIQHVLETFEADCGGI